MGGGCQKVQKPRKYLQFRASRQDGFAGCTVRQKSNGGVSISRRSGFFGEVAMVASHSERWREIYCSRDRRQARAKRDLWFSFPTSQGFLNLYIKVQ